MPKILDFNYEKIEQAVMMEIAQVVNEPGITWKSRRFLLKHKFNLTEEVINDLVGEVEPASDY